MSESEVAEDDAGLHQLSARIIPCRQGMDALTKEVESTDGECDKQALLGAEEAVDRPRRGAGLIGKVADRDRLHPPRSQGGRRGVQQRPPCVLTMLSRPAHRFQYIATW